MNRKLFTIVGMLLTAMILAACASSTEPSEAYKDETPQQIYQRGKSSMEDKSFSEGVKRFEALDVQYPYGQETKNAQLYLIYGYYMKEDYKLASAAATRFIRLYPADPNVDYAYYLRGLSDFYEKLGVFERIFTIDLATRDLTQMQQSYEDFSSLVYRFPNSRYAPSAHQFMIYLRNMIANHQLQVAEYYYSRKAYVAAADRSSNIVKHFEGVPAVKDALILMVKSYHNLGETKLENDAMKVLQYNYPNTLVKI